MVLHSKRLFDDVEANWKAPQRRTNRHCNFSDEPRHIPSFCHILRILEDGEAARWGILLTLDGLPSEIYRLQMITGDVKWDASYVRRRRRYSIACCPRVNAISLQHSHCHDNLAYSVNRYPSLQATESFA